MSGQWKNTALLAIGACYLARAPWGSEKLSGCSSLLLWVRESNEPHLPVLLGCSLVAERERLRQARLAVGGCALLEPPARLRHRAAAFCRRASSFALRSGHEGPTGEARKKARSGGGKQACARSQYCEAKVPSWRCRGSPAAPKACDRGAPRCHPRQCDCLWQQPLARSACAERL